MGSGRAARTARGTPGRVEVDQAALLYPALMLPGELHVMIRYPTPPLPEGARTGRGIAPTSVQPPPQDPVSLFWDRV